MYVCVCVETIGDRLSLVKIRMAGPPGPTPMPAQRSAQEGQPWQQPAEDAHGCQRAAAHSRKWTSRLDAAWLRALTRELPPGAPGGAGGGGCGGVVGRGRGGVWGLGGRGGDVRERELPIDQHLQRARGDLPLRQTKPAAS